jgi:hypothetical protein
MAKSKSIVLETEPTTATLVEPVKGKRGRKSKKELMAALGVNVEIKHNVILSVSELDATSHITIVDNPNLNNIACDEESEPELDVNIETETKIPIKKRGRKPKGGKIIQQAVASEAQVNDKPNVILHLKCSMKDLHNSLCATSIASYAFNPKNELCYDIIGSENINSVNSYNNNNNNNNNNNHFNSNIKGLNHDDDDYDYDEDENINKDANKEIWKKLRQLEHNLHINNVNNKKSACFWDSCDFDNPPVYIPKHFINGTYHVYGNFCSPECGVAYLMNENLDSSTKFERYHLFNHIYSKIYDYKKNIKPSPNPHYMLEKFYGNLTIQEYRSLLRNERLFIVVDKPLTRILPELHDDNDEFILNNKIIPSNNNYQLKSRMQRKKTNKSLIVNEKFGPQNKLVTDEQYVNSYD